MFGEQRDAVRLLFNLKEESLKFVSHYQTQFISEVVQSFKQQKIPYSQILKWNHIQQTKVFKNFFAKTSSEILDTQIDFYTRSCYTPLIREQFIVDHFVFMKNLVLQTMKC
jgi:hypothetical protein